MSSEYAASSTTNAKKLACTNTSTSSSACSISGAKLGWLVRRQKAEHQKMRCRARSAWSSTSFGTSAWNVCSTSAALPRASGITVSASSVCCITTPRLVFLSSTTNNDGSCSLSTEPRKLSSSWLTRRSETFDRIERYTSCPMTDMW